MQTEIHTPGPLLDAQGQLVKAGWARQPIWDCNLENTHTVAWRALQSLRLKRWDYYGLTTPTDFYSFTIADIGYLGSIFAYRVNFETGAYHEETLTLPLARGVILPRNSTTGENVYDNGRVRLRFTAQAATRQLSVTWPNFGGQLLRVEATLQAPPEHESMTIVIPIRGQRFYYNRKMNCLPVEGWLELGGARTDLRPETTLGNMDWGRGVWEYDSFWVWASASGFLPDGRTVGLNLGFGFGDTSAATENALIVNGRIHKLETVPFEYDAKQFMRPWTMRAPDGRLALEFTPFTERVAKTDLGVLRSEVHQLFGRYRGTVVTDAGETLVIDQLIGFAEEHHARW